MRRVFPAYEHRNYGGLRWLLENGLLETCVLHDSPVTRVWLDFSRLSTGEPLRSLTAKAEKSVVLGLERTELRTVQGPVFDGSAFVCTVVSGEVWAIEETGRAIFVNTSARNFDLFLEDRAQVAMPTCSREEYLEVRSRWLRMEPSLPSFADAEAYWCEFLNEADGDFGVEGWRRL